MALLVRIPVFTRSGKRLAPVRERRAKSALKQGQAVLVGVHLREGIRYKLPTDEEVAAREHEIGYDKCPAAGRHWRGQQSASRTNQGAAYSSIRPGPSVLVFVR